MSTCTIWGVALVVPKSAFYLDEFESIWLKRETSEQAQQCSFLSYTDFDKHIDRGIGVARILGRGVLPLRVITA